MAKYAHSMKIHYTSIRKEERMDGNVYVQQPLTLSLVFTSFFLFLYFIYYCAGVLHVSTVRELIKYNRTEVFFTANEIYCTSWRKAERYGSFCSRHSFNTIEERVRRKTSATEKLFLVPKKAIRSAWHTGNSVDIIPSAVSWYGTSTACSSCLLWLAYAWTSAYCVCVSFGCKKCWGR